MRNLSEIKKKKKKQKSQQGYIGDFYCGKALASARRNPKVPDPETFCVLKKGDNTRIIIIKRSLWLLFFTNQ
jgi:hypothetical protein